MSSPTPATVSVTHPSDKSIRLTFTDGNTLDFHSIFLRHNCSCKLSCVHPSTGEPIVDPALIDPTIKAIKVEVLPADESAPVDGNQSPFRLQILFSDQHVSVYSSAWLQSNAYARNVAASEKDVVTNLRPANLSDITVDYKTATPQQFRDILRTFGTIVVENGPGTPEDSLRIVKEKLGATIIPTHFGVIEDLRVNNTTNKNNDQLGYTNAPVDLHTDQPFIDTPPTMQMLHCITPAESGGLSTVADGIAAALYMRKHHSAYFRLLATVPVHFHRKQKNFEKLLVCPMIAIDGYGNPIQIRCSYFTMAPMRLNADEMVDYYAAYALFQKLIHSEQFSYSTLLQSGSFFIYDNYRMLHARTSFTGTQRFLRGIYVDRLEVDAFLDGKTNTGNTWD